MRAKNKNGKRSKVRERKVGITTISAVIAAITGVVGLLLAVAIDITPVREWEIWDFVRLEREGPALVVARLRNDEESRHTEELLGWIEITGKDYEELGRTWKRETDIREGQKKRRRLFERTDGLVLLEGYVGPGRGCSPDVGERRK